MTPVRDALKIAYGDEAYNDAFGPMSEDQVIEAAGNVTTGVRSRPRCSTVPKRPT
jgi:DNA-directed RNA polymerase subunit beta